MTKKFRFIIPVLLILLSFAAFFNKTEASAEENLTSLNNDYNGNVLHIGDTGKFTCDFLDYETYMYSWSTIDSDILELSEDGTYKALDSSYTIVHLKITNKTDLYSEEISFFITILPDMNDISLETTSFETYTNDSYTSTSFSIPVKCDFSLDEYSDWITFDYSSTNDKMSVSCDLYNNSIDVYVSGIGSTTLNIKINEKTFKIKINIHYVTISKSTLLIAQGKHTTLKITGTKNKITWRSLNKNVASVNSKGYVRAKKSGIAVITATVGDLKLGCAVNVTTAKIIKVIKRGKNLTKGATYSQAKRMLKGYYDCSSLVWRAYSKYGVKFGSANYAPTAADLGKWCVTHGKNLGKGSDNNLQKKKYRAGDLYFETGQKNGRYKNIYHVEMFTGYCLNGFDENGKPILGTTWLNRGDNYYWLMPELGFFGRP